MNFSSYLKSRPWSYHLTASQNLKGIRQRGALLSASNLAVLPSEKAALTVRRVGHIQMEAALIRDQNPLRLNHIEFEPGFGFDQLLALLNSLVFFWPGPEAREKGPIPAGKNHFLRYQSESPVILRALTSDLIAENAHEALVCRYNSGAPRTAFGRKSPRGPQMFRPIPDFSGKPDEVKELAFSGIARLPVSTETSDSFCGSWKPLL